jgi:SepF-like predicted cell division protein (DUF552 family)
MPFKLFHKKKQPEPEVPTEAPKEEQNQIVQPPVEEVVAVAGGAQEPASVTAEALPSQAEETPTATAETKPETPAPVSQNKTYLKAMPLRDLSDIANVENEVKSGNIVILKVTPLANKSIEDVKSAVNELYQFAEAVGGDIARLGEERVVICPKSVRIWREKTPTPVATTPQTLPTAA